MGSPKVTHSDTQMTLKDAGGWIAPIFLIECQGVSNPSTIHPSWPVLAAFPETTVLLVVVPNRSNPWSWSWSKWMMRLLGHRHETTQPDANARCNPEPQDLR